MVTYSCRKTGKESRSLSNIKQTQLTLRTFHTSGGATLSIEKNIINFFKDHLIDIKKEFINKKEYTTLIFDSNQFPVNLIDKTGPIKKLHSIDYTNNTITFEWSNDIVENKDVISTMANITNALNKTKVSKNSPLKNPVDYYQDFMTYLLEVGTVYSSFVEMLFANMLVTDFENKIFWRYDQSNPPILKLGYKTIARYISPLLGLLYEPNRLSIEKLDVNFEKLLNNKNLTVYEKIWLGRL